MWGRSAEPEAVALAAEAPPAGATTRGEGRARGLASATGVICAHCRLEKKEKEGELSLRGERGRRRD